MIFLYEDEKNRQKKYFWVKIWMERKNREKQGSPLNMPTIIHKEKIIYTVISKISVY